MEEQGAVLVADCVWPVETNFLSACINQNILNENGKGHIHYLIYHLYY